MPVTLPGSDGQPVAGQPPLTPTEITAWHGVPVSVAVDLEPDGQIDPALGLRSRPEDTAALIGRAFTVACAPPDFGAVVQALDHAGPGDVVMIAAAGRTDYAMIGEILGGRLRDKGCAGLVVDGAVRDIRDLGSWADFPVYARAINPLGPTSAAEGSLQQPVRLGGIDVTPGNLILGDADGLVALRPDQARHRLPEALAKLEREGEWIAGLAAGKAASEVFGL